MISRARTPITARLFLVALAAVVLLVPAPAMAHAKLKRSSPSSGAQLSTAPESIRLWFSEQPELRFTFASLKDSAGNTIRLGNAEQEASDRMGVAFRVLTMLSPGRYTLFWRTAASDGHPSSGGFSFVVLARGQSDRTAARARTSLGVSPSVAGKNTTPNQQGRREEEANAASSVGNSIARAVLFLGLLALIGAVSFTLVILRRVNFAADLKERMSQRAARLGMSAALLVIITGLARLYLESQMMHAMPDMEGMTGMTVGDMLMRTTWGLSLRIQLIAAVAALVGFLLARRRADGGWLVAAVAAFVLSVTPALGGHAAASPRFTSLMVTADSLHVLAAGSWLGSLLCVMTVGVPIAMTLDDSGRWVSIASLVNAFSPLALISAGVVVVTGTLASWVHLEHLAALWQTTYGQVLLVKLLFVAITFGIGAYNFRRVQPQLSNHVGTARLRRSAAAELATACLILLVTGLLTGISP
ncbi:MAG TPA: CopD family protein [Gemmatimonadaceae bacterium]|nr:CopD family protein [Gemmatimonadaceae bacterium]